MLNLPETMAKKNKKGQEQGQMSVIHHRKWLWLLNISIKGDNKRCKGIFLRLVKDIWPIFILKLDDIMQKTFNITGMCRPAKHYMADISNKLDQVIKMVEQGDYFIINRPRQYGKTTMLYCLSAFLQKTGEYIVFNTSFEGIGVDIFNNEKNFSKGFVRLLARYATVYAPFLVDFLEKKADATDSMDQLSQLISEMAKQTDLKIVLIIDEVDKSSNNQLFIHFLAMLRNKYLESDLFKTFHAVVLAGVHDVRRLKLKILSDEEKIYNSPWNIASEFKVNMNLLPAEIKPMLQEYASDRNIKMDTQEVVNQIFYFTSGYPFLVSTLCKIMDENMGLIKTIKEWTGDDVEIAVKELVTQNNTNFESLTKNLENNHLLYDMIYKIAVDNESISFNIHHPVTNLALLYGFIENNNGKIAIHNRIYNEVIVNYMINKMELSQVQKGQIIGLEYKKDNNRLNMEGILLGFQSFMKKEYSKKDRDFLEKNGRLIFMAFLKPIINGSGYDFKEVQISDEKRLDLVMSYIKQKYIAELKLWHGEKAHEKGLLQLADYLDRQDVNEGYLLIFDHAEVKKWDSKWVESNGKKIFAVWV